MAKLNFEKFMGYEWLAIAMFVGFFLILLSGYPVAFSFAGTALIFGGIGLAVGAFDLHRLLLLPNVWFGTMSNFTLLAIPFFVFLGSVFEKSGLDAVQILCAVCAGDRIPTNRAMARG